MYLRIQYEQLKIFIRRQHGRKISRGKMSEPRIFLGLVLVLFCVYGRNGQEISDEDVTTISPELTTILSHEEVPIREAPFPFKFPRDRVASGISKRIIGGNVTASNEYPYQVALYVVVQGALYFCGGTLITTEWILTAAHCVEGASSVITILGAHDISQAETTRVVYNTSSYIIHANWNSTSLQNDIALIKLPQNVTLTSNITTVQIAQGTDTYSGLLGRCLGWGKTILGSLSNVLRYVDAEIMSNANCSTYEDYSPYIVDHHLCTSGAGYVGSCNGDSGGPLIVDGTQVGIVSFGVSDCAAGLPSVYTRVTEFNSWIAGNIEGSSDSATTTENPGGKGDRMAPIMGVCIWMMISLIYCNYL